MKKFKLTAREYVLVIVLLVLLIGVCYYMFYLTPLQSEIQSLNNQCADVEAETTIAATRLASMSKMQKELDEIFARPESEITEIAPYDNAKVVMTELNGILGQSQNYKLTFSDPVIEADGTVRRTVNMNFTCGSYNSAKQIIKNLCNSHWRCLMKNLNVDGGDSVRSEEVSCTATIVFFESTNLE